MDFLNVCGSSPAPIYICKASTGTVEYVVIFTSNRYRYCPVISNYIHRYVANGHVHNDFVYS